MAQDLLPPWRKVLGRLLRDTPPTDAERLLLERMSGVFEEHTHNALSMTEA